MPGPAGPGSHPAIENRRQNGDDFEYVAREGPRRRSRAKPLFQVAQHLLTPFGRKQHAGDPLYPLRRRRRHALPHSRAEPPHAAATDSAMRRAVARDSFNARSPEASSL